MAGGVYFVKAGDTLSSISRLFDVDLDAILAVNALAGADIAPGDRLRIPNRSSAPKFIAAVAAKPDPTPEIVSVPEPAVEPARQNPVSSDRVLQAVCREETVYHSVVRGDTLFALANRYDTELDTLLLLNGLRKSSRLSIGQKIVVRKGGPRTHTVARGETLRQIASRYGLEAARISRLNRLKGNRITAGQRLLIQECDPYAVTGSARPALGGPDFSGLEPGVLSLGSDVAATLSSGVETSPGFSTPAAAVALQVINIARTMLNVPYRFGGNTLRGIDCSAYVQRVFSMMDVKLPRTAREQFGIGARVEAGDIQVGDLVFFRTYASFPSHVGIYLGDNLFIHASSVVRKVAIDRIDLPYYRKRFTGARRLIANDTPAVASAP